MEMNEHTILTSLYYGNPTNVYLAPGLLSAQVRHLPDHNNLGGTFSTASTPNRGNYRRYPSSARQLASLSGRNAVLVRDLRLF
jgi:hypothetical protein